MQENISCITLSHRELQHGLCTFWCKLLTLYICSNGELLKMFDQIVPLIADIIQSRLLWVLYSFRHHDKCATPLPSHRLLYLPSLTFCLDFKLMSWFFLVCSSFSLVFLSYVTSFHNDFVINYEWTLQTDMASKFW